MHELAIMESVLETVLDFAERNGAKEVRAVNLSAGALANIIPEWGRLFFGMIAKNTIAAAATLDFTIAPAVICCRKCGSDSEFFSDNILFSCSQCGSDDILLVSGKEFCIESVEVIVNGSS